MPPSPRIKATINETVYRLACEELNITEPTFKIHNKNQARDGRTVMGVYEGLSNHINIYLVVSTYESDRLPSAQAELIRTILHELRHGHQWFHNRPLFLNKIQAEIDAESWACSKLPSYRALARLSRTFPNSGFSRLSRHASRQVV